MPLAQEKEKPPLVREASVIQQVSNFIGIGSGSQDLRENTEEKAKWDKKRLRRIANKYKVNEDEVTKFVRNSSINQGTSVDSSTFPAAYPDSILSTALSEDVERGVPSKSLRRRPIGPTPSLPTYESTCIADSYSQTDISHSQTRISTYAPQRESVPSAVISSMSNFFKK
uniref:Uncharacterized protein n=1 Tax=Caenorhabditis japonica TaxID=281687 RepID=A0A8R1IIM3_CAEJA